MASSNSGGFNSKEDDVFLQTCCSGFFWEGFFMHRTETGRQRESESHKTEGKNILSAFSKFWLNRDLKIYSSVIQAVSHIPLTGSQHNAEGNATL